MNESSGSLSATLIGMLAGASVGWAFYLAAGAIAGISGGFGVFCLVCAVGVIADKVISVVLKSCRNR